MGFKSSSEYLRWFDSKWGLGINYDSFSDEELMLCIESETKFDCVDKEYYINRLIQVLLKRSPVGQLLQSIE